MPRCYDGGHGEAFKINLRFVVRQRPFLSSIIVGKASYRQ